MSSQRFSLYGKEIIVSEAYCYYNALRLRFVNEAENAANEFIRKYNAYSGIETFVRRGQEDGIKIIEEVIDRLVIKKILVDMEKIYDYDVKRFEREYYGQLSQKGSFIYYKWLDNCGDVVEAYYKIVKQRQQLDEYRRQRRENRGRWVGGGFGIGGAIKGAMQAGAMNMASGVAHGIFNLGAKALSSMDEAGQKSSLYSEAKQFLYNGIYTSVFNIHWALWSMLRDKKLTGSGNVEYFIADAEKTASARVNNFSSMDKQTVLNILSETLLLSPYDKEFYEKTLSLFGDRDGELEKIAEYFGVADFHKTKEQVVDYIFSQIKSDLSKSEELALKAKETFAKKSEFFGVTETRKNRLTEIEAVLADYDLKARTVEEFTMDTREEADKARKELSDVKGLLNGLNYEHSEADARKALHNLENYNAQSVILNKYLEKIHKLLDAFDEEARTVICGGKDGKKIVFEQREEATKIKAMSEVQDLEKSYQTYIKGDTAKITRISELLNANLPSKIRTAYFELISEFEDKQEKINSNGEKAFSFKCGLTSFVFFAIEIAILIFFAHSLNKLSWPAVVFIFIVPVIYIVLSGKISKGSETGIGVAFSLALVYWSSALLVFFLPDWSTLSWWGWKGAIVTVVLFSVLAMRTSISEYFDFKKAKIYVKCFEEFSLKVDEYKKFRDEHKKLQYENKKCSEEDRKYAEEIVSHVGGRENVVHAEHCSTRLKLVVKDNSKVDRKALENIKVVKGVFENNGQLQIIIGTGTVNKVYSGFLSVTGITE